MILNDSTKEELREFVPVSYTHLDVYKRQLQGIVFIALWAVFCVVLFFVSHVLAGVVHLVPVVGLVDRLGGMLVSLLLVSLTLLILYKGISVLGLMEGSLFAESQILHFCSQLLNPEVTAV